MKPHQEQNSQCQLNVPPHQQLSHCPHVCDLDKRRKEKQEEKHKK